ncbi:preprotein translocase subunit SecG [Deinococcus misasensis]|uniref:preprotein translocase subunit SecG n=1 Tax=Deinococcus misasensis TaxID=392413 RepID=UPI000554C0EC|nr:preprotein translocase subunit SecG [Deinococcus misasensis]
METLVYILYVVAAIGVVLFVLLQTPKQSGLSSGMGGGSDLFGGKGMEGGLIRMTSIFGGFFLVLALVLNFLSK